MMPAVQTAERWSRQATPMATILFMIILAALPVPVLWWSALAPGLVLVLVFYWAVYRPELIPFGVLFLTGIVQDSLSGAAMGVSSIVLMLVKYLVVSQRRYLVGKAFSQLWAGFALVVLAAKVTGWSLASLVRGDFLDPTMTFAQAGIVIALFPVATWLLMRIHRVSLPAVPP
ncbi:MAG: rod shape-determining protein MreD [Alphaproteobacteria bacterium]